MAGGRAATAVTLTHVKSRLTVHWTLDTDLRNAVIESRLCSPKYSHRTCVWRAPARAPLISRARPGSFYSDYLCVALCAVTTTDQSCDVRPVSCVTCLVL